jgi:hypothetical protein
MMAYYKEIQALLQDRAEDKLYDMMRQGLTNAAAIPEVETEPEQAAHHLLGCDNYMALVIIYQSADDARPDEPNVAQIITDLADSHLRVLTKAVMYMGGPIGQHKCQKGVTG